MNATTAVAERAVNPIVEVRHQLENMEDQFKAALPAHIPAERFARVVMTAIQQNPELVEVERRSLWNACMKAAQDGLLPDGREAALVVRMDSKRGKVTNYQPMIAGVRKKARNSGEIATWDAHVVRKGDQFQFQLGDNPQVNHTYDLSTKRGEIVGAYSIAVLKDGQKSYEVMSIDEIHAIRDRSSDGWKAYKAGKIKSTPWTSDEGEMCRKTVARRHSKVLPMSTDLDDLIRRDDDLYDMEGAREEAQKDRPRSLSARLDALAAGGASGAVGAAEEETTDPETGEITAALDAVEGQAAAAATAASAKPQAGVKILEERGVDAVDLPLTDGADDFPGDRPKVKAPAKGPTKAALRPATSPAEWTPAECTAWGDEAYAKGMQRRAVVPPELRDPDQAERAKLVLAAFDRAAAEANGQKGLV